MATYTEFLETKTHRGIDDGFPPIWIPDYLFDFQSFLVDWALRRGRAAIFADCGIGKTLMQLVWAQNIVEQTGRHVLLVTPLAVGAQTTTEATRFGMVAHRSRTGDYPSAPSIIVTNYERLHYFDSTQFAGVVCDESSILKHFTGATQKQVTRFLSHVPYRLLCTATAAPNDYTELGTSSEALGELGMMDMLSRFFKSDRGTASPAIQRNKKPSDRNRSGHAVSGTGREWRLKGHAVTPFWRWVASWARACQTPSDLGFPNTGFELQALIERDHVITPTKPPSGYLFEVPAVGLREERDERRRTLQERCDLVAALVDHTDPAVVWCHLNAESDLLAKRIPGAIQVRGGDTDDQKEAAYLGFADGSIRVLVTKPKMGAWGLNWQHCAHVVTFASHSYEQFYQSIRRCWRFGQTRPVTVDVIYTEGEAHVRENMSRKARAADVMFRQLVSEMTSTTPRMIARDDQPLEVPTWLL
jgi:hypothetical protein